MSYNIYYNTKSKQSALDYINNANVPEFIKLFLIQAINNLNVYKEGMITLRGSWHIAEKVEKPPYDCQSIIHDCAVSFTPFHDD